MNSLLTTIKNLTAKSFLMENVSAPTKYGLGRPERKIEIYSRGSIVQSIFVTDYNDTKIAFSPRSKMVVEIEDTSYNNLELKVEDFIDTSVTTNEESS
jgi:hypothetical protein